MASSFLWLIGWGGGLPPYFGQKKSRKPFLISCSVVPLVGGWLFSFKSSGQVGPMTERLENWDFTVPF